MSVAGRPVEVVDAEILDESRFRFDSDGLLIESQDREIHVAADSLKRGWIRRLGLPDWRARDDSRVDVVRAAWLDLTVALTQVLKVEWLTPLDGLMTAESKLRQYAVADRLGCCVPKTVVTSDRRLIPAALGDQLIAKPLGPAQFIAPSGEAKVVYATELTRDSPYLDELAGAPFLLQERIPAVSHLRVVTVNSQAWTCRLDARELPADWRQIEAAHSSFEPTESFPDVQAEALRIAAALGVGYSSQDWIVSPSGTYFVDLNPAGQWLFLPEPIGAEITGAIAAWLGGRDECA